MLSRLFRRRRHILRLRHRVGRRLFDQNMHAGLQAVERLGMVRQIRRENENGVQFDAVKHIAEEGEGLFDAELLSRALQPLWTEVGQSHQVDILHLGQIAGKTQSSMSYPGNANANFHEKLLFAATFARWG